MPENTVIVCKTVSIILSTRKPSQALNIKRTLQIKIICKFFEKPAPLGSYQMINVHTSLQTSKATST
jgi:hypothetical protein